jgi:hypothetical protein
MFSAGFKVGAQPGSVAVTILEAIETPVYKLRWPVGDDAWGMYNGRRAIADEAWVSMGDDLSDEDYNQRYFHYFGIQL